MLVKTIWEIQGNSTNYKLMTQEDQVGDILAARGNTHEIS